MASRTIPDEMYEARFRANTRIWGQALCCAIDCVSDHVQVRTGPGPPRQTREAATIMSELEKSLEHGQ